jgi:hypothetical protein
VNTAWVSDSPGTFTAEASTLGIAPYIHPARSYEARDPWERELPHVVVAWTSHKAAGETTHWTATVRAPDGNAVVLKIFNT